MIDTGSSASVRDRGRGSLGLQNSELPNINELTTSHRTCLTDLRCRINARRSRPFGLNTINILL